MQFHDKKASKEQRLFRYPLDLELRKYCTSAALADGWGSTYQLGGIVLHDGGANGGHYCYVQKINGQLWWLRDDAKPAKDITPKSPLGYTREACALVYLRTPPKGWVWLVTSDGSAFGMSGSVIYVHAPAMSLACLLLLSVLDVVHFHLFFPTVSVLSTLHLVYLACFLALAYPPCTEDWTLYD